MKTKMVNLPKLFKDEKFESSKIILPLLPLRDIVVFPYMVAPLFVGRTRSVNSLSSAMNDDKSIFLVAPKLFLTPTSFAREVNIAVDKLV